MRYPLMIAGVVSAVDVHIEPKPRDPSYPFTYARCQVNCQVEP
jgi:hypothetical protein